MRVLQPGDELGLGLEAADEVGVIGVLRQDDLDRDIAPDPRLDGAMRLPLKVSTATSNFMIGVTAAASAGVYIGRGDVDIALASPVAMGVLLGAFVGARLLGHLSNRALRIIFVPVLAAVGVQTVLRGLGIGL